MRNALLLSLLIACASIAGAQTPATPSKPAQTPAKPRAATPPRATQATAGRSGIALVVTDPVGKTLGNVTVDVLGPTMRTSETNSGGQLNFSGLQAGTYRLRFSGEEVTAFEREVTLRASQTVTLDISLSPAPPPREIIKEAPAPLTAAPVAGPQGELQILSLVDLAEQELERKQARRETLVSCSGRTRSTLLQLNQDQPQRLYEDADSLFYVVAGEGVLRVGDAETHLSAGSFASVPRSTSFVLGRRGRNPLILLSVLSGEPCEEAK